MSRDALSTAKDGTLLNIRVSPGAKRASIEGSYGEGAIRLKVAAPPWAARPTPKSSVSSPNCSGSRAQTSP